MGTQLDDTRRHPRAIALAAAAMYGAAAVDGCAEGLIPGDPPFATVPVVIIIAMATLLLLGWRLIPVRLLPLLGPLGVALVGYVMGTTPGPIDAAVLYALPVLWGSLFYGRRGAVGMVACVGVFHALALLALPGWSSYPARWIDVMVSAVAIAVVVVSLEERNERLLQSLSGEARTDELTGLLNRRGFNEAALPAFAHARRAGSPLALVTFDIDHFKAINDAYGHDSGDLVLIRIGELLRLEAREVDLTGRWGGEEFVALLPDCDAGGARTFAERIRHALSTQSAFAFPSPRVSAGIVVASGEESLRTVLARADLALYEAKRAGRDRVVVDAGPSVAASEPAASAAPAAVDSGH